jgi:hypothetical protein
VQVTKVTLHSRCESLRTAKRGQSAFEFLSTYGWAFLVILVMIGSLAYFGVLDLNRFLPETCMFESPMSCDETQGSTAGILAKLRNTQGTIKFVKADYTCTGIGSATPGQCDAGNNWCNLMVSQESSNAQYWLNGEVREMRITIPGLTTSALPKCRVNIGYVAANQQFERRISGTIRVKVQ